MTYLLKKTKIFVIAFILPLFAVACELLLPQNTYAVSFDGDVIEYMRYPQFDYCTKTVVSQCSWSALGNWITTNPGTSIEWLRVYPSANTSSYTVPAGTFATLTLSITNFYIDNQTIQSQGTNTPTVISWEKNNSGTTYDGDYTIYLYFPNNTSEPWQFQFQLRDPGSSKGWLRISNVVYYKSDAQYQKITNTKLEDIKTILNEIKSNSSNAGVIDAINDQTEQQQQNREDDQQSFDDAQTDASTDGSQSSSDATASGQTLLQAFISFVGAITSATPSNCNINMDTGFINFGNVNLCSLSPPPAFQAISSIVVIGFAVPLSLAAAKKMIELFRSFQT